MADFSGTIARNYDDGLGPVIFEPYAIEVAQRIASLNPNKVLEISAGTGRLTNHLVAKLPPQATLVATDLQEDMLAVARQKVNGPEWQVADSQALPFPDNEFDVVVNQFGIMFVKDKPLAHREALRVLKPGGTYALAVWSPRDDNPWSHKIQELVVRYLPQDTPGFMAIPFSYSDRAEVESDMTAAGFQDFSYKPMPKELVAPSAASFAMGAIEGNPLGATMKEQGIVDLQPVIHDLAELYRREYGDNPMRSQMKAVLITARKPAA